MRAKPKSPAPYTILVRRGSFSAAVVDILPPPDRIGLSLQPAPVIAMGFIPLDANRFFELKTQIFHRTGTFRLIALFPPAQGDVRDILRAVFIRSDKIDAGTDSQAPTP